MNNSIPLVLSDTAFLGKGCHKNVYVDPEDATKCIKIPYSFEGQHDIDRELSYRSYRDKHNQSTPIIAKYYGTVATDLGTGYVFDRICDYDGHISTTLRDYTEDLERFEKDLPEIIPLMLYLKKHLFEDTVISMNITSENIIFQQVSPTEKHIFLLSDLGVSEFIPLVLCSRSLATAKIQRRWDKMLQRFAEHQASVPMNKLLEALKKENIHKLQQELSLSAQ